MRNKRLQFLLICYGICCVSVPVRSGVILDKLKQRFQDMKHDLHNIANKIVPHEHHTDDIDRHEPTTETTSEMDIDVRMGLDDQDGNGANPAGSADLQEERRLINVKSNCKEGQRVLKSGRCVDVFSL